MKGSEARWANPQLSPIINLIEGWVKGSGLYGLDLQALCWISEVNQIPMFFCAISG